MKKIIEIHNTCLNDIKFLKQQNISSEVRKRIELGWKIEAVIPVHHKYQTFEETWRYEIVVSKEVKNENE